MTTIDLELPSRALAIGAHPDDIEFGCGATLAKWAAAGCDVTFLVLTDGARGSWNADESQTALVETRHEEQRAAARTLGANADVIFLDEPDGELRADDRVRTEIARSIRQIRPDVVLGHDPWKQYRLHPDHRNAGFLTIDALVAAREPLYRPNLGLLPHRARSLLLFEAQEIDHLEQISDTFDKKVESLAAHRSQLVSTMGVAESEIDDLLASPSYRQFVQKLENELVRSGQIANIPLAEAFKRIDQL